MQKYVIFLISIFQLSKNISSPIPPSHICQIAFKWSETGHIPYGKC
jgi:hypothetical protein